MFYNPVQGIGLKIERRNPAAKEKSDSLAKEHGVETKAYKVDGKSKTLSKTASAELTTKKSRLPRRWRRTLLKL
jgi:hypothetical protein